MFYTLSCYRNIYIRCKLLSANYRIVLYCRFLCESEIKWEKIDSTVIESAIIIDFNAKVSKIKNVLDKIGKMW